MMDDKKSHHKNGGIHLIASNKDHNFEYNGFCKIKINHVSSMLEVEPITEEFKYISAMFQWKFYAQKNILFVFADFEFKDFILVFNTEARCQKVYDLIYRKNMKDEATNELIYNRILLPILNQITKVSNIVISQILLKWINKLETNDKEMYIKMMKESGIYDLIYPKNEFVAEMNSIGNDETGCRAQLKRNDGTSRKPRTADPAAKTTAVPESRDALEKLATDDAAESGAQEIKLEYDESQLFKIAHQLLTNPRNPLKLHRQPDEVESYVERKYGEEVRESLAKILNISNIIKIPWNIFKISRFPKEDFVKIQASLGILPDSNRLDKICNRYKRSPKSIIKLLSNPELVKDKRTFDKNLDDLANKYEVMKWLQDHEVVYDCTREERWYEKKIMKNVFSHHSEDERQEILEKFFKDRSGVNTSNLSRLNGGERKLEKLGEWFQKWYKNNYVTPKGNATDENRDAENKKPASKRPKRYKK
uniref:Uncharacterized protein n=1 Tax=Panagrolaimus davidi TaxID=227884 RepID=A0A914PSZ8_9BILA